jgi:hypothetical protein
VAWGYHGDSGRALQLCPAVNIWVSKDRRVGGLSLPFAFVVDDEFENTVPVRCTECDRVFAWRSCDGQEGGSDVGIQHGKLQLHIIDSGVRLPLRGCRIVFGDMCCVDLGKGKTRNMQKGETHDLVVDGVCLGGLSLVHFVMRDAINSENMVFLEGPACNFARELLIA